MELKQGHRQSEIGPIPIDWKITDLSDLCILQRGFDITEATRVPGAIPVYSSSGLAYFHNKAMVNPPGVVTGRKGILGKVFLIDEPFWPHDTTLWVKDFKGNHPPYVALVLRNFRLERLDAATSVPTLNRNNLAGHLVAIPATKAEQEAIAEALTDADALIESLEQLLAKKRLLKQGAMQELLTGKKRLPGFRGEWQTHRLDELGRWTGGMTPSMRNPDYWQAGTVPWISSGDVKSVRLFDTSFSVSESAVKSKATTLLPANSIVVVTRSGILRKYLPVAMNMVPMAINQDIKALLPDSNVVPDYLLHSLTHFGDEILATCLKSGTTVESIEFPWLKGFAIPLPPREEQTAVANVLSDMDNEISVLETKLAKVRNLKQAMMQELLTGKIRLIRAEGQTKSS